MKRLKLFLSLLLTFHMAAGQVQNPSPVDSLFIGTWQLRNDFRATYGTKSSSLVIGSSHQPSDATTSAFYNNVNDLVGFGLTYKFIDFDFYFTLPKTKLMNEGIQNLQQFRLSGSYYGRKWTIQASWRNSQGLVVGDAGESFQSTPDVHLIVLSVSGTYNFNSAKYSYRAAHYQNESQKKSAGGFLLRFEPFYRRIGVGGRIVPAGLDVPETYGEQVGLEYVTSPGLAIMPGYGHTFSYHGRFFVSPVLLAGMGLAFTSYKGSSTSQNIVNSEWGGSAVLNMGYSGDRFYVALRSSYDIRYFKLDPSWFTTADIRIGVAVGYRFSDFESAIPRL